MTDSKSTKTAIALGNFDGLHKGHADVISNAVKQSFNGLVPYVLIFDQHPQQVLTGKMPRQLMTYKQLKEITEKMGCGIVHISFDEIRNMTPDEFSLISSEQLLFPAASTTVSAKTVQVTQRLSEICAVSTASN